MAGKPKFNPNQPFEVASSDPSGKPPFDPNAYYADAGVAEQVLPVEDAQPEPVDSAQEAATAGLQGFGQGGTLGYLPQLQAGFGYGIESANEFMGGTPATPYEELKQAFERRDTKLKERSPIATGIGNVAGAVSTLPTGGAAKGAGLMARVGRAALAGGAYGGLANPEVTSTEDAPDAEMMARLKNAGVGLAMGGVAEGALGKLGAGISKSGEKLSKKAVVKQIGANAGQIKKILQKNETDKIGGFLANEGLLRPGTSLDDVVEKSSVILKEDGPKIGQLYSDAQDVSGAVAGIDGNQLADKIVAQVKAKARNHPDRNAVGKTIEDAVAPLRDMGENANIVDLHDFRKGLDENINWGAKAQERDAIQRAYITARNLVADETNNTIKSLDETLGGNQLDLLKKLNARYSTASTVNNISTQGAARETAKAFMGAGMIGAGAGGGAAALEYRRSHDPLKAIGAGLVTTLGVTGARKFGAPVGYYGGKGAAAVGRGVQALTPGPGAMGAGSVAPWVNMNREGE